MGVLPIFDDSTDELTEIFKDLHEHPEIGFTETRTASVVAEKLRAYGVDEVHTGIAKTGVVGLIKGKGGGDKRIGLRADMDALPIHEETNLPYASKTAAMTAIPPCSSARPYTWRRRGILMARRS